VIDYSKFGLERGLLWTGVVFGHDAVKLPCFMTRDVISLPHQALMGHIRVGSPVRLTPVVAPKLRG
jgi:hypothetical protein